MAESGKQGRRMLVGSFLLAGLVVAAIGVFLLDWVADLFEPRYRVVAVFPEAPRVRPGTIITLAGHRAGTVRRVDLRPISRDTTARVAAVLELDREVQSHVRRDSEVRLTSQRVIGDPVIDIMPGTMSSPIVQPGDTLRARTGTDLVSLIGRAKTLRPAVDSLMDAAAELQVVLTGANAQTGEIAVIQANLAGARQEFARFSASLDQSPLTLFLASEDMQAAFNRIGATFTATGGAFGDGGSVERAGEAFSRGRALGPDVRALAARTDSLRAQVARLRAVMQGGFPTRMGQDSALLKAVHGAQAQLDSLVAEVKKNPLKFVF